MLVAMENFEKCTVAMLGGPCSQHVMGNTSRLNQPQSDIHIYIYVCVYGNIFKWWPHDYSRELFKGGCEISHRHP